MLENIVKTLNSLNTADFLFVRLQEIMIILIKDQWCIPASNSDRKHSYILRIRTMHVRDDK